MSDVSDPYFPHTDFEHRRMNVVTQQPMMQPTLFGSISPENNFGHAPSISTTLSITANATTLPGFDLLHRVSCIKIHNTDFLEGYSTCLPGYKVFTSEGDQNHQMLLATSDTLFCPFDSKEKCVYLKDIHGDCIFYLKFTPSICECDSEEKRCFAVFSPVYSDPFGAIMFESGEMKNSLRILNSLEAETYAVHFNSNTDIMIKSADGVIVAVVTTERERCSRPKFTLTLMEEVSTANKTLFICCAITLDLVKSESTCTRCICLTPKLLACLGILGLTINSYSST